MTAAGARSPTDGDFHTILHGRPRSATHASSTAPSALPHDPPHAATYSSAGSDSASHRWPPHDDGDDDGDDDGGGGGGAQYRSVSGTSAAKPTAAPTRQTVPASGVPYTSRHASAGSNGHVSAASNTNFVIKFTCAAPARGGGRCEPTRRGRAHKGGMRAKCALARWEVYSRSNEPDGGELHDYRIREVLFSSREPFPLNRFLARIECFL